MAAAPSPPYPASDLSDPEWTILAPVLPPPLATALPRLELMEKRQLVCANSS